MDLMGDKLGPLLFQFGYFNQTVFKSGEDFLARSGTIPEKIAKGYKFAVEIRNKKWLSNVLRSITRPQSSLRVDRSILDATAERDIREIRSYHR